LNLYNSFPLKILVVDTDANIRHILKTRFSYQGYHVITAVNSYEAISIFKKELPHFIILDVILSKCDGYKICKELRKSSGIPIILLTALSDITDCVISFEYGADDYVIKPFALKELDARIRSLLSRVYKIHGFHYQTNQQIVTIGDLRVDIVKKDVLRKSKQINLTKIEFNLLELLITKLGITLTRETIFTKLWGYKSERYGDTRVIDVHISRLRSKLEENSRKPKLIVTVRGVGYLVQNV